MNSKFKISILSILCLMFFYSCDDIASMTKKIDEIQDTQNQIILQQDKMIKSLVALEKKVSSSNTAQQKPPSNNKRKTPNPNFVHNISIGNSIVLGNPEAKVTVTKFTDFQWPYCARSVSLIDDILAKYPNDVKVVIKNFPLGSHKQARKAAKYALAADRQGKFKEMYHIIFENYKQLRENEDLPQQLAAEIGLDVAKLFSNIA